MITFNLQYNREKMMRQVIDYCVELEKIFFIKIAIKSEKWLFNVFLYTIGIFVFHSVPSFESCIARRVWCTSREYGIDRKLFTNPDTNERSSSLGVQLHIRYCLTMGSLNFVVRATLHNISIESHRKMWNFIILSFYQFYF